MAIYQSMYKGAQMDAADTLSLNPDATPTENSTNLVTSGGVFSAIGSAQNASAPAILNTASGAVCSFADGSASPMTSVVAEIVASQAGSGTPYPAGGGKNKFDISDAPATWTDSGVTFTKNSDGTITANGTATAAIIYSINYQDPTSPSGWYCRLSDIGIEAGVSYILNGAASGTTLQLLVYGSGAEPSDTGSGSAAFSFSAEDIADKWYRLAIRVANGVTLNNVVIKPMIRLASEADATFAPYSIIRPITGYTGANVYNPAYAVEMGGINDTTGADTANTIRIRTGYIPIQCFALNVINLYGKHTGEQIRSVHYYTPSNTFISTSQINASLPYTTALTVPSNAAYARLVYKISGDAEETADGKMAILSNAASVSWQDAAGTVYGGTVDLVSGVLTVTHKIETYSSDDGFIEHTASNRWYHAGLPTGFDYARRTEAICNQATYHDQYTVIGAYFAAGSQGVYFNKIDAADTLADLDTRFANNPCVVVYPLATPQTYTLTGQEVASLLGQNNVWNDVGGDTSATYRADTKLYIQSLLGA